MITQQTENTFANNAGMKQPKLKLIFVENIQMTLVSLVDSITICKAGKVRLCKISKNI